MDLDSVVDNREQPNLEPMATGQITYVHIVLYFSSSNTVFWNIPQMVYLHSTDCFALWGKGWDAS